MGGVIIYTEKKSSENVIWHHNKLKT